MISGQSIKPRSIVSGCAAAALLLQLGGLCAQNPLSQPAYLSQPPFPAANLWMTNPLPWSPANDPVPSAVRQARDQYFDQLIGYREPLTPANVKGTGISEGVPLRNQSEIPELPNRTLVIATFTSYQPVLSRSGRAIYTEATFSVSNMFEDNSGHTTPGNNLVLIIPGGTVTTNGMVLSFLTQPRQYSVSLGRTYLLAMSYHTNGAFFILGKDWDVTDGVVKANFSVSSKAPASLIGLTLQQLVAKLDAQFGR
jgi:hypothetical protein